LEGRAQDKAVLRERGVGTGPAALESRNAAPQRSPAAHR
jgi:hypothetical protein